jgi:hypothetical protein
MRWVKTKRSKHLLPRGGDGDEERFKPRGRPVTSNHLALEMSHSHPGERLESGTLGTPFRSSVSGVF